MRRRNFIRNATMGAILPGIINGFSVKAIGASSAFHRLLSPFTETDHVLVLIQLTGGNDGLNTVLALDQYGQLSVARGNILIPEAEALALEGYDATGLHPAMTGMQTLFNEGKLQIVQGVGYPEQNYSHFRSTDIWMTGSDADEDLTSGWAGRYLEYEYPNYPVGYPNATMPDPLAIQIGSLLSVTMMGSANGMGVTISSADDFYNLVTGVQSPVPNTHAGKELAYIRLVAEQSQAYNSVILNAANNVTQQYAGYPAAGENVLADQLKIVSRLIAGGLKTRLYMVSLGSFDTHSNQVDAADTTQGDHAVLLQKLSDAIYAFVRDLEFLGTQNRVVGMTFSEFGRRIKSNASVGSDHGAGAPLFVFGHPVQSGVLGQNPAIPDNATTEDNIAMQYDFRSVYASMLQDWLCVPSEDLDDILLHNFQPLPIINSPGCISTDIHELNQKAGVSLVACYPNPFTFATTVSFQTEGGHTLVQVFNTYGQVMNTLVDAEYAPGYYSVYYNGEHLPAGTYYCRLQNGVVQQVKTLIKVR